MNMTVNSLPFLVFFTLTAVIYYLFPRLQWVVLLLASLVFYSLAGARTFLWLILTILTTYGAVRWIEAMDDQLKKRQAEELKEASHEIKKAEKARTKKKKRHVAALFIIVNIGILALLKYGNFLIDNANYVLGLFGISPVNRLGLAAPLGISYYTLQSIGYVLDVYKGKCKPEHNILKTALFVCFFPQMTQGPIGRFPDLAPQLFAVHKFSYENLLWTPACPLGFFQKMRDRRPDEALRGRHFPLCRLQRHDAFPRLYLYGYPDLCGFLRLYGYRSRLFRGAWYPSDGKLQAPLPLPFSRRILEALASVLKLLVP